MSATRTVAARRAAARAACLLVFAGAGVGLGAGVAGADDNGIADKDAPAVADAARKAMSTVTAMRMAAKVTDASGTIALDLRFDERGNCVGTVEPAGGSGTAEVIKRGDDVWMKLDDELLRAQVPGPAAEDAIALVNGRYVHGTTKSPVLSEFAEFCDLDFFKEQFTAKPTNEQLTKGSRTTVDGRPAITLTSRRDGETGSFQVSTQDEPYLLRIQGTDASGQRLDASFSAFDEAVPAKPPASADSIDLSQLQ